MKINILPIVLLSCSQDVSIMKMPEQDESLLDTSILTDSQTPIAEGISGYLHYYLKQVACPQCVGETQELKVLMELSIHEPISGTYTEWIPPQGNCINTFYYTNPSTSPISLGSTLNVQSIHPLSLHESTSGVYYTELNEIQYDRNNNYTVYSGDTLLFDFQSLHGFDSIEPYTLLWVDPSYAFETPIQRTGSTFWWTPNGDSTQTFNITIAVYSWDGSQLLGYTSCSGADTGQMTIPGQYLSNYPSGSLTAVHLTRHKITLEPSEYFNSHIESHMEWEVIGTGHIE